MLDAAQAVALLDKLAPLDSRLATLETKFRREADEPENPVVRAVSWALGYRLLESAEQEARTTYGGPFAPMVEMWDGVFPPYLANLPNTDETIDIWRKVVDRTRAPGGRRTPL